VEWVRFGNGGCEAMKIQEYLSYLIGITDAEKKKIEHIIRNMRFYNRLLKKQNNRYSDTIKRLIAKLNTAYDVIDEVGSMARRKPNKRLASKLISTKDTLIELLKIYQAQNKYAIFSDSDTELFTKPPLFDALKEIDFILNGKQHNINIRRIIKTQICYLHKCLKDKDVSEADYRFNTHSKLFYYTLLNNLQSAYRAQFNLGDIVLIAYAMIYEIIALSDIKVTRSTKEDTFIFLSNILSDLKIKVDLTSPSFDVLSIDCEDKRFMAVPTLYLEHHGQKFTKDERKKISEYRKKYQLKKSKLIFYQKDDKHVIYNAINYDSNKLHITVNRQFLCSKLH